MSVISMGILLDNNLDLLDNGQGDFLIGETNTQEAQLVMLSKRGDWKQYPTMGVNLDSYLNSPSQSNRLLLQNAITSALQNDGFSVQDLIINFNQTTGELDIQTAATRIR